MYLQALSSLFPKSSACAGVSAPEGTRSESQRLSKQTGRKYLGIIYLGGIIEHLDETNEQFCKTVNNQFPIQKLNIKVSRVQWTLALTPQDP